MMNSVASELRYDMFLVFLIALFTSVRSVDLPEPKFQVLTPDELMVEVPHYGEAKLVMFRIGVRRKDQNEEYLELGENDVSNHRIFIYDQRLNLQKDDVVNYLLAFRDKKGYEARTGNYVFDGVYCKKPRRNRFRRSISTTTVRAEFNLDGPDPDTEEAFPVEPRFGHHPHRGGGWPNHGPHHGFNPFGPHRPHYPPFSPYPNQPPPFGPPPNFGGDCNDHRHDRCHGRDTERIEGSTETSVDYHCKMCKYGSSERTSTTTVASTTEDSPEINIRFSD
nr:PREDICTED: uncharacterized protein LOC657487 [Tribolium castaneum]|eukprot:XP_976248.2 PREDICTED: uncharacterized protein LOC657487 [Tribolium castaneum]